MINAGRTTSNEMPRAGVELAVGNGRGGCHWSAAVATIRDDICFDD
jgi:hypothetical protein